MASNKKTVKHNLTIQNDPVVNLIGDSVTATGGNEDVVSNAYASECESFFRILKANTRMKVDHHILLHDAFLPWYPGRFKGINSYSVSGICD